MVLDDVRVPIVQAPLAGGPSTPELAAAVCEAGALGFFAAGYKAIEDVRDGISAIRSFTDRPFGVNVFVPTPEAADPSSYERYVEQLRPEAERYGVELGEPRFDDDQWDAKLELLENDPVSVVSFTFGCPPAQTIERLTKAGSEVWVTVTDVDEAKQAEAAGATGLVLQGVEAGGHRSSFEDKDGAGEYGLLALIQLTKNALDLPLIASGGIATGNAVAAVLAAGASAAQIGTAFMLTKEAGTAAPHREAIARPGRTALTRAFSGRRARGIVNRFQAEHTAEAPVAYPELHYVTSPVRAAARKAGDPEAVNLWAGQAHELARETTARELVEQLATETKVALKQAAERVGGL